MSTQVSMPSVFVGNKVVVFSRGLFLSALVFQGKGRPNHDLLVRAIPGKTRNHDCAGSGICVRCK
ncbi:MAG TPA: hypothetical protein DEA89_03560 [Candidatus Moranbacteria bacterium]|nr:hypothetical protein [Candidatus Moranbacteria bacterium]HBI50846.1 hypothetical protein [Candidatus Moranbacteria bacterium]HBU10964.1 hypothetical protein [Candidatus Moranbacteria bacterium]HCO99460.1 hypothetical protein [Candidatus Moranbacteria bacterium]